MRSTELPTAIGSPRRLARGTLPPRPGALVDGRFRVEQRLAAGGFGTIFRATHLASGHQVALKVLHADHAADPELAARFRREGAALASLRDPHTVATYELGEAEDGTLFIAMELLRGASLLDRLRAGGPLPWRRALAIARAACSSLAEAHDLGIVHRDLKPGNIHLEPRGGADFVKLLDFGVAKLMRGSRVAGGSAEQELTRVGEAIGTLEYMAPEQIVGAPCDARTDIYALGIVLYEMLTGRRPFASAVSATSLATALLTQTPVAPSVLVADAGPPALDRLVLRCLEREPGRRFGSVHELAVAIDHLRVPAAVAACDEATWIDVVPTDHPVPPTPVPPVPAVSPPPRRGGLRVAMWLLAGTACGVVLAAMATFG
jgi:serine/threonine-protein kinase